MHDNIKFAWYYFVRDIISLRDIILEVKEKMPKMVIFVKKWAPKGMRDNIKSVRNNIMRVILFRVRDNIRGGGLYKL